MNYDVQLQFTSDLLKNLHISSCIVNNPQDKISCDIDLGLRAMLFGKENYTELLENSMNEARDNTIYRFYDEYSCNYIFMRLPGKESAFFYIGPYLPSAPSEQVIKQKSDALGFSDEQFKKLVQYYNGLPIIEDENILLAIANTLGLALWGNDQNYCIEYVDYAIPDRSTPIPVSRVYSDFAESPHSLAALETNYANEKRLMEAISQGKLHKVNSIASSVYNNGTEQRVSDNLRNRKNYLIILNTLLRKAAESGGVHPLHLDRISSAFAKKIENTRNINDSITLQSEMIRDYCLLVKQHSLNKYSYIVGKAITIIAFDLTADLSLNTIAKQLNINPTYLSSLFRKECDCTLTEYVNRKRIEHAITLLDKTDKPINAIAFECGIQDTNYFIKLFKKFTNQTPTQYRNKIL